MSKPFREWTMEDVHAYHKRRAQERGLTGEVESPWSEQPPEPEPEPVVPQVTFTKPASEDESNLNGLEKRFLNLARAQKPSPVWIGIQCITLKLAHDCRLTVDFVVLERDGAMRFIDVKGFQREDALLKMKFAARTFPMFKFEIVTEDYKDGPWRFNQIPP